MRWVVCTAGEVPGGDGWLGPRERVALAGLEGPRRIADWRLGRWTAKRLLGEASEILVAADGAPISRLPLSIAHRRGRALAVVGEEGEAVGCDLEPARPDRDVAPFVAWEAAAKALRRGLLDGERPEVSLHARRFEVAWPDGARAEGSWWAENGWILAVASAG